LNGIGKGCKEMEDGGKFSLGVSPKFFDGIEVRKIGREVNQRASSGLDGFPRPWIPMKGALSMTTTCPGFNDATRDCSTQAL
jgi:hypothetical protein